MSDRRGVSETVSFVLVFSLIVSTVGVVYAFGVTDLQDTRDAEQVNNVERAFELLASNLDELVSRTAPSRATEIRLQGGTLSSGDPVTFNVSADFDNSTTDPEDFTTGNVSVSPIVYSSSNDVDIVYSNGAIIRDQPGGTVMVRPPDVIVDDDRVAVPLVQTRAAGGAVGGESTVLVRTTNRLSDVYEAEGASYDAVTINVTSTRVDAWERYLSGRGMTCNPDGTNRISCTTGDVDEVYTVLVDVGVSFE